jgi:hypothetical protein
LEIELTQFPFGAHDDIVDALGLAGQLLDKVWKATPPRKPDVENDWDRAYRPASEEYGNSLRDSFKIL